MTRADEVLRRHRALVEGEGDTSERYRRQIEDATAKRGTGREKAVLLRLNEEEYSAVKRAAEAEGVPVATFVRAVLMRALDVQGDK